MMTCDPFNLRNINPRKRELIRLHLMKQSGASFIPYRYPSNGFCLRLKVVRVGSE